MIVLWLIVWLLYGTPDVLMFGPWTNWGVALAVCAVIDFVGVLGKEF